MRRGQPLSSITNPLSSMHSKLSVGFSGGQHDNTCPLDQNIDRVVSSITDWWWSFRTHQPDQPVQFHKETSLWYNVCFQMFFDPRNIQCFVVLSIYITNLYQINTVQTVVQIVVPTYERLGKKTWNLRKNTLWRKTDLKFQGEVGWVGMGTGWGV